MWLSDMLKILCVVSASAVRFDTVSKRHVTSSYESLGLSLVQHLNISTTNLRGMAKTMAAQWSPGQNMVTSLLSASTQSGILHKLEGATQDAQNLMHKFAQRSGMSTDMFFIGFEVHITVPTMLGPGIDFALYWAVCLSEGGCNDARPWTSKTRKVKKWAVKTCGGVVGGGTPVLGNIGASVKTVFKPTAIEIVPLLMVGFGGFKSANGPVAEFGGNLMSNIAELAVLAEMNPDDLGGGFKLWDSNLRLHI